MPDRVRESVATAVAARFGSQARILGWDGGVESARSWKFSFHVDGPDGGDLVLKIARAKRGETLAEAIRTPDHGEIEREYDGLRRIAAAVIASGDPGLTAVEPICLVPEVGGILMRRIVGRSLRRRLGLGRGRGDTAGLFDRIGRWAKVYYEVDGPPEPGPFSAETEVSRSRRLESELRHTGAIPDGLLSAMGMLRMWAEDLDGHAEPVADMHGELTTANVLVASDDRIAVIDPARRRGPVLDDLAALLTDVALGDGQLATGGVLRPAGVVTEWETRLMAGAELQDEPMAAFRLARAAVDRWIEVESGSEGRGLGARQAARPFLRRQVRRRLAPTG